MAAQNNTNGLLGPNDSLNTVLHNDSPSPNVAVHTFDPEASPAQKGAVAGKGKENLKDVRQTPDGEGEKEVAVDTGHSNVVPTIMVQDTDNPIQGGQDDTQVPNTSIPPSLPGGIPQSPAPNIPDWYKTGWRAVSGIDRPPVEEEEEKQKSVLDMFLAEQYYGTWYHNAALICFAVFASHFLTRFHFGWGWLFIVLAVCNTYYTTSMARVRRRARDDVQRELVKVRLASEHESADWMNNFLDRFWRIYEPVLSQTIVSSVDQILSTNTPAFLDSLRLATFTLGTKAPRIDKVRTFPKTPDDIVMMDWGISFTPNDVSDMTPRQALTKVNPKIVLSVRVGKGLATAAMPILLEDITFCGLMRIRMKLMSNFPHVQVVDLCFLELPVIDYVLKPLGGETFGFDIANIPGLSGFIREMTHATLGPMMYDPNVFTLNLEQLLSGAPLDTAIGVLQVTVESARGVKGVKIGGGTPDPYIGLSISNREQLARTKHKHNTYNPTWMETKFMIVNSLMDTLTLTLFDYNDHRKDTLLASANFELSKLTDDATQEGIESTLLKDGKERGLLRYAVSFYPVLSAKSVDGKEEKLPETTVGIARLTIHQAKELDATKSLSGDLNPLAKVYLGGSSTSVHTTLRVKHTNNPVWESATEFLCSDKASSIITVKVIDDRDFMKDPVVGYMSIRLEDLLDAKKDAGRDWWMLSGCKSGKLRLSADWKPLDMAGSFQGADQYRPPIGVVRLWLDKATDVKNVEAALGGKSDPYVRVQVNNITKGRTEVVNNNLNPVWDQFIYIPVHSLKETLFMECMDYQHLTKDRSLGSVELRVSDLANESEDVRFPYASTGTRESADPIRIGSVYKGRLHYIAQFVPAVALKGVVFEGGMNEIQRAANRTRRQDDDDATSNASSVSLSSLDEPDTAVPPGITVKRPIDGTPKTLPENDTVDSGQTAVMNNKAENAEKHLVQMSKEELLQEQSGIIVFNVISGHLAKKARLEVLLDDGYWPAFTTVRSRSTQALWEHVGEGFLKELDFGRVWLRLNDNDEGEKENVIAEWKGDAKAFLDATLDGPKKFTLVNEEDNYTSTVEIETRYVPVPVKLDSRESINNQGTLRVELIDGREIRGVDRGGKSDPFAVFSLGGQKVFKSQTKKKTLTPEWKENFVVAVPSRVKADFSVEIFDWNQIEQAKSLGSANIDLADIEPFQAQERVLNLLSPKHGEKGQIRVRLMFQPEIIAKSRKNTSTFSAAGRAMTTIGSLPVGAGRGVFHGVTGVFKKEKDVGKHLMDEDGLPPVPTGQASQPIGQSDILGGNGAIAFPALTAGAARNDGTGPSELGTLRVTVLHAKDLSPTDIKPYVIIRVGGEERKTKHAHKTSTPEWNESFNFSAGALTPKLFVWIWDHRTLGKDRLLGEAEIDIWRHIQPATILSTEVSSELTEGQGLLRMRLEFDADAPLHGTSISSMERTQSIASPSRFSLRSRRPGPDRDDEKD